jgi:delta24(24(1))-sterol reductase
MEEDSYDSSSATDNASSTSIRASKAGRRAKIHTENEPDTNGSAVNGHSASNGPTSKSIASNKNSSLEDKVNAIKKGEIIDGWMPGLDPKVDYSGHFEFGGSWGVSAIMVGFTLLMYYMWIGAIYYDGKLPLPEKGQSIPAFVVYLGGLAYNGAFPSLKAWTIYWTFFVVEMAFYCLLPGIWAYGKPLPFEGGKQLKYYCSGVWSFYATIIGAAALHFTGVFPLYTLLDEFGPIMSVAISSGWLVAFVAYFSALARGAQHRMTGYPVYDFFMGAELNPRMFGILDFKMFFEVRLPWYILFGMSCAAAARQYHQYGYVSGEIGILIMAHFLYANACSKGEECIVTTW